MTDTAPSNDVYHLAADRGPPAQLSLGLAVKLDPPAPLAALTPGDRFLLESTGVEGRLEAHGTGSATVLVWRDGDTRWTRTTWALSTEVRRLRG
jgi:hypothetical protein